MLKTGWKFVKWLIVFLLLLVLVLLGYFVRELFWKPRFDDDNPRHATLVEEISRSASAFSRGGASSIVIDLSSLNDGDWATACLYGPYSNPLQDMIRRGAKVSSEDQARLEEADRRGFRAAQVEETEAMIAYLDSSRDAHFVHFQHGFGQFAEVNQQCISKPETLIRLQ